MITKQTIDRVFETARVEEVIGEFVQLKKAGSNFKGLSPFSDEKSPSFMVSCKIKNLIIFYDRSRNSPLFQVIICILNLGNLTK